MAPLAFLDLICQFDAENVGFPGTFKAWVSGTDEAEWVVNRLGHSPDPYVRPDGVRVAANWDALVSGAIEAPINRSAYNVELRSYPIWTGTATDGTGTGQTCGSWSLNSNVEFATVGMSPATDDGWTADATLPCNQFAAIYCVEQPLV